MTSDAGEDAGKDTPVPLKRIDDAFAGRTVLVTAGVAGIGGGVTRAFAQHGADVVVADLDGPGLARLELELAELGIGVLARRVDATDSAAIDRLVAEAVERFGGIDILVSAAGGYSGPRGITDVSDEEWESGMALNVTTAFKAIRAVTPVMRTAGRGRIIVLSSASGRQPSMATSSVVYYAAGKAALLGLMRQSAIELGPHGITVNAVAPGTTYTPRLARFRSRDTFEAINRQVPLGRISEVEDQVGPILFLASDAAGYVNGATLDVNGGRLMM
jgi:3-oxoacyl-[acyl-carrier protein] reductase